MTRVRYVPSEDPNTERARMNWGKNDDPGDVLTPGNVYEVAAEEIHNWHTKIVLVDFPDLRFNSVHFEEIL